MFGKLYKKTPFIEVYEVIIGEVTSGTDFYNSSISINQYDGFKPIVASYGAYADHYLTWINIVGAWVSESGASIVITGRNSGAGTAKPLMIRCHVLYVPQ